MQNSEPRPSSPLPYRAGVDTLLSRKPVGSRRSFNTADGFLYGVYANSIIIAAALTYSLTWPWPDANIPLGIVMVCLAFVPMFTVYAMLTCLMPRMGGDYVWQSRTLGGFWAYILVFTPLLFGPWFYMASNVAPGSSMVAGPTLISLGTLLKVPGLVEFAQVFSTRVGAWWFYVFYVTFAAIVVGRGMRFYATLQRWSFMVGMLAIISWIVVLLLTSVQEFQAGFNLLMRDYIHWGEGHAYTSILGMAASNGFRAVPLEETTWTSSFLIGPVLAYTFMYIAWTGTLAGEIEGVRRFRNSLAIYLGGNIFAMVLCAGFMWLMISRFGNEFFTSANFLWATENARDIPIAPHFGVFLLALVESPWWWLWTAIGLNAWFWIWPTNNMVMSTRVMFAMSFDNTLPGFLTKTSKRWGTPIVAIGICYAGSLVLGWLYYFTGFSELTLNMPFMTSIAFAASTLAGTFFPYFRKTRELYRLSPLSRYTVFGLPLITVSGILGLAYFAVMFYLYITDDKYGTNHSLSAWFIVVAIAVSGLIYLIHYLHQKRQGLDVSLTYREIPSE